MAEEETTNDTNEEGDESNRGLDSSRWRCFSPEWVREQKGDSLDITWIKDEDSVDHEKLPYPEVLAAEAMGS